jgi:hypothetical protein
MHRIHNKHNPASALPTTFPLAPYIQRLLEFFPSQPLNSLPYFRRVVYAMSRNIIDRRGRKSEIRFPAFMNLGHETDDAYVVVASGFVADGDGEDVSSRAKNLRIISKDAVGREISEYAT